MPKIVIYQHLRLLFITTDSISAETNIRYGISTKDERVGLTFNCFQLLSFFDIKAVASSGFNWKTKTDQTGVLLFNLLLPQVFHILLLLWSCVTVSISPFESLGFQLKPERGQNQSIGSSFCTLSNGIRTIFLRSMGRTLSVEN
jgi:hypothetical protein